ncbi:nucleotidyltransferase family protein [Loktanella sp. D2R18]|uniref:nucleotidyltransferase family protein n=1 Tax=Rhodobacterales TaxID=204455 RepID=UPI000DE93449|nr:MULTISPECIES: nucleotidyltransferase family protein [Rhodobacterales]MDO6590480.1 nucleotidyltransferase family protein [Yoonia sp. 1_MG-2023]RBW41199.1 nucleotidyltransferase family protein [Loktanella sp. D2R18]
MTTPILLFAAGLGTRMGALTKTMPKPLVKVAGKPLIDHALAFTQISAIGNKVVNVHYCADQMHAHLAGRGIATSDETDLLRNTGGGLRHALPLLGASPALTMNTDAVWRGPNPIEAVLGAWRDDMEALLLVVEKRNVHGHLGKGDFQIDDQSRLHRAPDMIYTGVQMIRTETIDHIDDPSFSLNLAWNDIATRGGLYGVKYDGQWCDVGQPSSIPIAEAMLYV